MKAVPFRLEHPEPKKPAIGRQFRKVELVKSIVKGPGVVVWGGKSLFNPDEDIAVIANGFKLTSGNRKTGAMVQVYIINANLPPWQAIKEGWDDGICGDCKLRPQLPNGQGRACYVQVWPYVETVWKSYQRWSYTPIDEFVSKDPFRHRFVRVGTYGDPAAVPTHVWNEILQNAAGWTAYTHAWKTCDPDLKSIAMASVDTPDEYNQARAAGWRAFRSRLPNSKLLDHEIICPASAEAEKKVQCIDCRLCDGRPEAKDNRKNIAIIAHGNGARWFEAAVAPMGPRKQMLLELKTNRKAMHTTDGWLDENAYEINNVLHNDQDAYTSILDSIGRVIDEHHSTVMSAAKRACRREAHRLRTSLAREVDFRCVSWTELGDFWIEKYEEVRGGGD